MGVGEIPYYSVMGSTNPDLIMTYEYDVTIQ